MSSSLKGSRSNSQTRQPSNAPSTSTSSNSLAPPTTGGGGNSFLKPEMSQKNNNNNNNANSNNNSAAYQTSNRNLASSKTKTSTGGHLGSTGVGMTSMTSQMQRGTRGGERGSMMHMTSMMSTGAVGSGSRRGRKKKKDDVARVLMDGKDVTPQPLMQVDPHRILQAAAHVAQVNAKLAGGTFLSQSGFIDELDLTSEALLRSAGMGGVHSITTGAAAFAETNQQDEQSEQKEQFLLQQQQLKEEETEKVLWQIERMSEDPYLATAARPILGAPNFDKGVIPSNKVWSEKEIREKITIKIEETDTLTLLHIPSLRVWGEDELSKAETEGENALYHQVKEKHKERDKFSARSAQTFNPTTRDKDCQAAPPQTREMGVDATTWDIYDSYAARMMQQQLNNNNNSNNNNGNNNNPNSPNGTNANNANGATSTDPNNPNGSSTNASGTHGGAHSKGLSDGYEEDKEEDFFGLGRRLDIQGGGGSANGGAGGGNSNTPSAHTSQRSFLKKGGASQVSTNNISWHGSLSTTSRANLTTGTLTSTLGGGGEEGAGGGGVGGTGATGPLGNGEQLSASDLGSTGLISYYHASAYHRLLRSHSFYSNALALENALLQNVLHKQQLLYRNHVEAYKYIENDMIGATGHNGVKYELKESSSSSSSSSSGSNGDGSSDASSLLASLSGKGTNASHHDEVDKDGNPLSSTTTHLHHQLNPNLKTPQLVNLWSFSCGLTAGMTVSCLSWNVANGDLLAAGYGSQDFSTAAAAAATASPSLAHSVDPATGQASAGGLILFWSLKNPTFPAKIFRTKAAVTSLDFCTEHPHLLAVGLYDGHVHIYDIRDNSHSKAALESTHATGKHAEPVWGVKWVSKDLHKNVAGASTQQLMSISSDGKVYQWSIKKGLIPYELMSLKRMINPHILNHTLEGLSRDASGLCFDFPFNDGTQYLAATEDGLIHKCSVSYNEQTLENYYGHSGPVYKVKYSPFLSHAFLSCSADWSAALWSHSTQTSTNLAQASAPVLRFASGFDAVSDICWSPTSSVVFGLVSREGRIEVWDLENSPLDPAIKFQSGKQLSCLSFCPNAPVILTGSSDGSIEIYRVEGVDLGSVSIPGHQQQQQQSHGHGHAHAHAQHAAPATQGPLMQLQLKQQANRLQQVMETHNESKTKLAQNASAGESASKE